MGGLGGGFTSISGVVQLSLLFAAYFCPPVELTMPGVEGDPACRAEGSDVVGDAVSWSLL